ncbi:MAG: restriction endonuclease subunit S [Polyangiales bacterium]
MSGRAATSGVIPGRFALAVGKPDLREPPGWRWTPLVDVARLESGHTPSRKCPEYWGGDIPWIGIRDAGAHHGRTILDTAEHITPEGVENSAARVLPAETVCLSRTASVGYVTVMGRPMTTSQDFVNWVCGPGLAPKYLKYVLLAELDSLSQFSTGSTHQTIYFPEVKAFHALLPPPSVQDAIVEVLGALDDKIELNRGIILTIDELIDAEFTRLRDAVSRHATWGGLITMKYGKALESIEVGPFPVFGTNGQIGWTDAPLCAQPGIVVGRKGAYRGIFFSQEPFWVIDTAFFVTMKGSDDLWWAYHEMKRIRLNDMDSGSAIPSTSRDQFERLPVRVPERSTQASFRSRTWPLRLKRCALEQESRTLAELRDSLLPKLLSGALRVRDAEKIIGEVT